MGETPSCRKKLAGWRTSGRAKKKETGPRKKGLARRKGGISNKGRERKASFMLKTGKKVSSKENTDSQRASKKEGAKNRGGRKFPWECQKTPSENPRGSELGRQKVASGEGKELLSSLEKSGGERGGRPILWRQTASEKGEMNTHAKRKGFFCLLAEKEGIGGRKDAVWQTRNDADSRAARQTKREACRLAEGEVPFSWKGGSP